MPRKDELKYCAGLIHLRAQLRTLVHAEISDKVAFFDGEDWEDFPASEAGVVAASEACADVDDIVRYRVGNAVLQVIYDGPYTEDNAEEIINDTNERAEEILS